MKIINLIRKELWQRRVSILIYSLIGVLFLLLYVGIYPTVQKDIKDLDQILQNYPKALLEAFNIQQLQMATLQGYIAVEYFSFIWPIMALLISLSHSVSTIAGEVEKKTMGLLLSLPYSRAELYLAKFGAGLLALFLFSGVTILSLWPIANMFGFDVPIYDVVQVMGLSLLFSVSIFSMGFLVSSIVSEKSRAYFILGGTLLIMYVANIVAGLVSSMGFIKYGSLFNYYEPSKILSGGSISGWVIILMVGFCVACLLSGLFIFKSRDISV